MIVKYLDYIDTLKKPILALCHSILENIPITYYYKNNQLCFKYLLTCANLIFIDNVIKLNLCGCHVTVRCNILINHYDGCKYYSLINTLQEYI